MVSTDATGRSRDVTGRASASAAGPAGAPVDPGVRAEAVVDLAAITANTALLCRSAGRAAVMAVVKADGYGHGAQPAARAALAGGASLLGVATLDEAVSLRHGGIDAPLVAWLWPPAQDVRPALAAGVQVGVASVQHLGTVTAAASAAPGGRPQIHLKLDTGLGRNGAGPADMAAMFAQAARAEADGLVEVVGLMSHLASADIPGDPSVAEQTARFTEAIAAARAAGLRPRWHHLANTAGTIAHPATRFDLVRCGIGLYGLCPVTADPGLRPAMTLRATVALAKRVPAGQGVGYGLTYRTAAPSTLALVPLGYGDGLPRNAGNVGEVLIGGTRRRIAGRVAMDQVVVDCGDDDVHAGDEVLVFGPGDRGEPTARDWAGYCDTIDYEIVTRIGPRVPRRYPGVAPGSATGGGRR
ncbi:MAG TPA: alanine racemase [Nakamurella sp.]|nr:alanine racemase [Nakamurella sp.]